MQVINHHLFLLNDRRLIWTGLSNHEWCRCLRKFMNAFVVTLRDESPKLASVIFPVMSDSTVQTLDIYDVRSQRLLIANLISLTCFIRHRKQDSSSTRQCICACSTNVHLWTSPLNIRHGGINRSGKIPWTFQFVHLPRSVTIELSFY